MSDLIRRAKPYPQMFNRQVRSKKTTAAESQLTIIQRKALLGDARAQQLSEEHGPLVTQHHAKLAAESLGRCSCERGDGIVCARKVGEDDGPICWPCWTARKNGKDCQHTLGLTK